MTALYEAAATPAHWPRFLEAFTEAMDATHAYMTAVSSEQLSSNLVLHGYEEQAITSYHAYYQERDVVLHNALKKVFDRGEWAGSLEELVPLPELQQTEIYNDYIRPAGLHRQVCMGSAHVGPYLFVGLAAWRSRGARDYGPEQIRLLELLAPHFKQALLLHHQVAALRAEAEVFRSGVESTGMMLLALDASGCVLTASKAARSLLERRDGLAVDQGELHALDRKADEALQRLFRGAHATGTMCIAAANEQPMQPGGSLLIPRGPGSRPLQLLITPFRSGEFFAAAQPAALIFLSDPESIPPSRAQVLRDLYGLSPVESRLVDLLLHGLELRGAAERLSITYHSARFYLKEIFRKTQTRRQVELYRMMASLPSF